MAMIHNVKKLNARLLFTLIFMSNPTLGDPQPILAKIQMTINQQIVMIDLYDNSASREFLMMLPLSLTFTDFAHSEKIAYLPKPLTTTDMANTLIKTGDFTYYAPWGNVALFYQGMGNHSQLYPLGTITKGKNILANLHSNFMATIEQINPK